MNIVNDKVRVLVANKTVQVHASEVEDLNILSCIIVHDDLVTPDRRQLFILYEYEGNEAESGESEICN